ncbi:adenylate/guanylate cyclase domain-containing protein [Glaciecola sp. SC05]|uniref:adenylate/guanylate cyclase domain-containing protein n=1 Tax=Glaciecola sp. SC05 TaxID=1987355 RepID=UPI0035279D07
MTNIDELINDVQTIVNTEWNKRTGQKVPTTTGMALAGGAVELDATFLYADLANSSKIAKELDRRIAAKIIKSFLMTSVKLVKLNGGSVVSFDGDRILGVFYGAGKNSSAVKCALNINYAVSEIIRPKFEAKYNSVKNATFKIEHGVGVDTGTVLAVRGGVRGENDLIWIGRAANLAAKLSDIRESPNHSFITASVYNRLNKESIYANGKNMWEKRTWNFLDDKLNIYRSTWYWEP